MLILSRKIGESIQIDHDVKIVVLDTKGKQVRLGIEAPAHVKVHRSEIYDRIQKELKKLKEMEKEHKPEDGEDE